MREKCGLCFYFSPVDDDTKGQTGVCSYQCEYQRVSANQTPRHIDSDGTTCFRERAVATGINSNPRTGWWRLSRTLSFFVTEFRK